MFKEYRGDKRVPDLLVYPTLFMGLGNIVGIPAAIAIGSSTGAHLLVAAARLHLAGLWLEPVIRLALYRPRVHVARRGQSEALCPLIVQEINYLHVRGNRMAVFSGMQTTGFCRHDDRHRHITTDLGWRWWYGIVAIVSLVVAIGAILIVPESRYQRDEAMVPSEDIDFARAHLLHGQAQPSLDNGDVRRVHVCIDAACLRGPESLWRGCTLPVVGGARHGVPECVSGLCS